MLGIGVWIESESRYREELLPGLVAHAGADTVLLESRGQSCAFAAAEEILDGAAGLDSLEALVLLRDDVRIESPDALDRMRAAVGRHPLTIAGAVGARNVTSLRWWEGEVVGSLRHAGGAIGAPAGAWTEADVVHDAALALSPLVVGNIRCDRRVWSGAHGLAAELCALVRASGGAVGVTDLPLSQTGPATTPETLEFLGADVLWRARWSYLPDA
jgi:hypothetical protein